MKTLNQSGPFSIILALDFSRRNSSLRNVAWALLFSFSMLAGLCRQGFAQSAGEAEVSIQGYYMGGNGQPLMDTSGVALNLKEFIPGTGLLDANLEGYGGSGFRTGTNFVGLQQAPLRGWKWDFLAGDFQFHYNLVENPFQNVYAPDLSGRGARIVVQRKNRSFQFFVGEVTLLSGPRVPYRVMMPQLVTGASMWQKVGERWEFGVRYMNLATNSSVLSTDSTYFFPGRNYKQWNGVAFQSIYHATKHWKLYTEANVSTATNFTPSPVGQKPLSLLLGPDWETDKFTFRANYALQSTTYLPMLGTFVGDRKGPYVDGHYRLSKRVDLYGSGSLYSNNLEHNPELPTYHSAGETFGASFLLPWKLDANGSLSTLRLSELTPSLPGESFSHNRQLNLNVTRPLRRHSLRLSYIDMNLNSNTLPQVERLTELDDTFVWRRVVIGGAIREQNTKATDTTNTLFYRGSLTTNFRLISAYGYLEKGNDLVNKSVFSTSAYSSSLAGVSTPLRGGWTLHLEAFRNNLLTHLNPENIFLFGNAGLGVNSQIAANNQWNAFVRISKQFHWGRGSAGESLEEYTAAHAPLVGYVRGLVLEQSLEGMRPAPNVAVSLDHYRSVVTDANGHYDFGNVPEGNHEVALDMEQLPTDYEPGASTREPVMVNPKATARADFNVVRLAMFSGRIVAPPGVQIENVLIRLAGTNRYTTPYQDGSFSFYDLHEGDYQVEIDSRTLPEGYMLTSPASVHVSARSFTAPPPVEFEIKPKPEEVKPVRQTVQQEIHVGGQGVTAEPANSRSGGRAGGEKGSTEGGGRGSSTKGSRSGVGRGTRGAGNGAGHSGAAASGRS